MNKEQMAASPFVKGLNAHRTALKHLGAAIRAEVQEVKTGNHLTGDSIGEEQSKIEDRGEVLANLMLTYRAIEDASMRIGKAIQAFDGGISVYDPQTTVGSGG